LRKVRFADVAVAHEPAQSPDRLVRARLERGDTRTDRAGRAPHPGRTAEWAPTGAPQEGASGVHRVGPAGPAGEPLATKVGDDFTGGPRRVPAR